MTSFDEPLKKVVGRSAAPLESALGISTVGELLRHYPRRYAQRGELTPIASLEHDEHVTVVAKVSSAVRRPMKNRQGTWLDIEVTDGKEKLHLAFFGKGAYVAEQRLTPGTEAMFSGKVGVFVGGRTRRVSLTHPEYESFDETEETAEEFASALVPIYPSAQGLPSWKIRRAVRTVLDVLSLDDPVPAEIRERLGLLPIEEALRRVHRPRSQADVARSHDRLKFDEAFVLQAVLVRRRMAASAWLAMARPGVTTGCCASSTSGCRSSSPRGSGRSARRSPPTSPVNTPCTGSCRARSARARPWSRCARCSRWSTPAGRPCCSPPPRSSPSSTTGRS